MKQISLQNKILFGLSVFFLTSSFVLANLNIETNLENSQITIKTIKITSDGTNNGNEIISIDGTPGSQKQISVLGQAIIGDYTNKISTGSTNSTVLGGNSNEITKGENTTLLGGYSNTINGQSSSIIGGFSNNIIGDFVNIFGGSSNEINDSSYSSIIGGKNNSISGGLQNTIAGGENNEIIGGKYSFIAGGQNNKANSENSFAGGKNASANHEGTFIRSDSAGHFVPRFESSKENSFLIRATNGVGINTNNPNSELHVDGTVRATDFCNQDGLNCFSDFSSSGGVVVSGGDSLWQTNSTGIHYNSGNVGIGTNYPIYGKLHILGYGNGAGIALQAGIGGQISTRMFMRNDNTFYLSRGSSDLSGITISPEGYVGIGTSGQTVKLQVAGSAIIGATGQNIALGKNSFVVGGNGLSTHSAIGDFSATVGGASNQSTGYMSTIIGGWQNTAIGNSSSIIGGNQNTAIGNSSSTIGGNQNKTNDSNSVVIGGTQNIISKDNSVIIGGWLNKIQGQGQNSSIIGGYNNKVDTKSSSIIGGENNYVRIGQFSSIIGGTNNNIFGPSSTIIGGDNNFTHKKYSIVGGYKAGSSNTGTFVRADYTNATFESVKENTFLIRATNGVGINTNNPNSALHVNGTVRATDFCDQNGLNCLSSIGGGGGSSLRTANGTSIYYNLGKVGIGTNTPSANLQVNGSATFGYIGNQALGLNSFIIGGENGAINITSGNQSSILGGLNNQIGEYGDYSNILGGNHNTILGGFSIIGGGAYNAIGVNGYGTILGGSYNTVNGQFSTIPGGNKNSINGNYSFAAGQRAVTSHNGTFVRADYSNTSSDFSSTTNNQFNIRAAGGTRIFSNSTATIGVELTANGNSRSSISDRNKKENFTQINKQEILEKFYKLPITERNYIGQEEKLYGPMAQDFNETFDIGNKDLMLSTQEIDGITMVALQALIEKNDKLEERIEELERRLINYEN